RSRKADSRIYPDPGLSTEQQGHRVWRPRAWPCLDPQPILLLSVRLSDLPHQLRPGLVDGPINGARVRPRVVLQDLDHQARIVGDDHARLQHPQESSFPLGLAEYSRGVDRDVPIGMNQQRVGLIDECAYYGT